MTRSRLPMLRPVLALAMLAATTGVSACAFIDEDAELDPRVMETPTVDTAREANYPRGSANPNPPY